MQKLTYQLNQPEMLTSLFTFIMLMKHISGVLKDPFFYTHLLENIATPPTSQMYWINATGLSITEQHLERSYARRVKQIKDKKLAETNFKI